MIKDKWYCNFTRDQDIVVTKYFNKLNGTHLGPIADTEVKYIIYNETGAYWYNKLMGGYRDVWGERNISNNRQKISFEYFEKYILNKESLIKDDYSYLIKILKRYNIK